MTIRLELLSSCRSLLGFDYEKKLNAEGSEGDKTIVRTDHEFALGLLIFTVVLVIPEKQREVV